MAPESCQNRLMTSWWFLWVTGIFLPLGFLTNVISLLYIRLRLEVNSHIAKILTMDTTFKVAASAVSMIGFLTIEVGNICSLTTCSLHILPILASLYSSYFFQPAVAVVR